MHNTNCGSELESWFYGHGPAMPLPQRSAHDLLDGHLNSGIKWVMSTIRSVGGWPYAVPLAPGNNNSRIAVVANQHR